MSKSWGSRVRRAAAAGVALIIAGSALAACTIEQDGNAAENSEATETTEEVKDDPAEISVEDGAEDVEPVVPVTVTAPAGLEKVTMTNEDGKEVEAELNDDKTEWTTAEPLGYSREYTVEATTESGKTSTATFSTVTPSAQSTASLSPQEGEEVGVGQAISFYFDIAPSDKQAVEDAITVETSNDTEGGFIWLDANQLRWRPVEYWEPGTEVTVKADFYGRDLGDGIYGAEDTETSFTVGDEFRTVVNNYGKTLTVFKNGEEIKSFPVSLGEDGAFDTPNGTYVVGDQHDHLVMDSRTYGLALENGGYVTPVDYATQLSYSGIYVHSAPWAIWALGKHNQSHGCINARPDDALWFLQNTKRGDPVEIINTGGETLSPYDGLGYWNIELEPGQSVKAGEDF
ncbi:L,D-transpeptidase family protein [Corynebacterium sp. CCUG 71335]|uniref:L,D-transpeptidase n=1 Tax=unclassified Corynebacterium TaxID=2624378 RepID=UPI002108C903|nr:MULTISPECIES: Ig-like domain-containing protein [unclassified Corynebacterium]MCQ4621383.1 L,D-transpeptidase family protein [Corynebacterium sp. CCUG 71335]MCQ4623799.1 L,D-transpeptidase family protein [Corynebacterium sp. CCUG 70398]MCQ4628093.1 L,D-transpeptidase family protein [Corynebacterium sp. CCUG 65737]